MVNMTGVEQRHENVDIEQRNHEPVASRFVEQPLDILGTDRVGARSFRKQGNAVPYRQAEIARVSA